MSVLLKEDELVPIKVSRLLPKRLSRLQRKRRHQLVCMSRYEKRTRQSFGRVGTKVSRLLSFAIVWKQKVIGT